MPFTTGGPQPRVLRVTLDGATFEARGIKEIFQAYRNHLASTQRRLLPGDEERLWEALALAYPKHVKRVKGQASPGVSVTAAKSFLAFVIRRGFSKKLVDPVEAERRAAICRTCPKAEPVMSCITCRQGLKLLVNAPYRLDVPEGCGACLCWLPAKLWLLREHLGPASDFPYWEGEPERPACWMRD